MDSGSSELQSSVNPIETVSYLNQFSTKPHGMRIILYVLMLIRKNIIYGLVTE